ncbi:MAG TPA: DNA polymerase III subunit delta [Bacteroidales bacterium]|nr:DNA polymerase III subunit delta [Bacteroidales bacterium]HPO64931.1 DNA polymerase III subunit delta [Bacteroidales bacterium]
MPVFAGMKEYVELLQELRNKIYHPVYFFMGEEPFYMDLLTEYIEQNVLTENEKVFNQHIFFGKDSDIVNIINTARRYPMSSNYQVVIIKEAQELKDISKLLFYLEKPMPSTILVVNYKYGKIASNTKLYKALNQHVLREFSKIKDYQLAAWITQYLTEQHYSIAPDAAELLADCIGNNLSQIVHELEKLFLLLPPGVNKITRDHIEKNIGISKDFNVYELEKAIGQKNVVRANMIARYFASNPKSHPLVVTIGSLFNYFSRLLLCHSVNPKTKESIASALGINPIIANEYLLASRNYPLGKVVRVISMLREYDMKSKGIGTIASEGELLKELIFKIMH